MPFENNSSVPGIDWISESFPEVLAQRLNAPSLFILSRDDRLNAFDRLSIPAVAKPSRATVIEIGQQLDADYIVMGNYQFDGKTFTARAHVMDTSRLHLSPEFVEAGALTSLITIQTALTWDVLNALGLSDGRTKDQFVTQFPPIRLDALENYVRGMIATDRKEKIQRFRDAVRLDPNHSAAMLQLGKACYSAKDFECAITSLSRVSSSDAGRNEAQFYLGLAAFYSGQWEKAESAFQALSSSLPLTEVYNNLGVVAVRRGERRARRYFEKTVETDPNDPDYHFNLAVELSREGDSQGAIHHLRAALALRPDAEARNFLDTISSGTPPAKLPLERIKQNYDESSFRQLALEIENANESRLSKMDPAAHADFHVQRGNELLGQDLSGEAEKEFREAVILDPASAAAHAGLARVLETGHDPLGARNEARASLRLKPSAEAYLVMARLDLAENNSAAAEQNVEKALAIDPADHAAVALQQDIAARITGKTPAQRP